MLVTIQNQAQIPNKYLRFAKWKMIKLSRKFEVLLYAEVFIQKEGTKKEIYSATIRLGVGGPDIIIREKSDNLRKLWSAMSRRVEWQLRRHTKKSNEIVRDMALSVPSY